MIIYKFYILFIACLTSSILAGKVLLLVVVVIILSAIRIPAKNLCCMYVYVLYSSLQ